MSETPEKPAAAAEPPPLRLFRPKVPAAALGLAVSHLMTKPAFARLQFGEWSKILAGQINRNHYVFVVDAKDRIVGFAGWAVTDRETAENWVEGRAGFSDEKARGGNCVLFNAWAADTLAVNRFLLQAGRAVAKGKDTIYFKRHYANGATRPVRLSANQFIAGHLARSKAETGL